MKECWIENLFHPDKCNVEWLLDRFAKFIETKIKVDACAHREKSKHAPEGNTRIIFRELGRENLDSVVLLYESKETIDRYVDLICTPEIKQVDATPLTKLCIQRGIVGDTLDMVGALKQQGEDLEVMCNALRLIECIHLAFFCSEEYEANCCADNKWILKYVVEATKNVCLNRADFDMAFANCGDQMETLLRKCTSLVMSNSLLHCKQTTVKVWHMEHKRTGHLWQERVQVGREYEIQTKMKASKVQIPTTYVSSTLMTTARPIPEVPLPACTGSMAT